MPPCFPVSSLISDTHLVLDGPRSVYDDERARFDNARFEWLGNLEDRSFHSHFSPCVDACIEIQLRYGESLDLSYHELFPTLHWSDIEPVSLLLTLQVGNIPII